MGSSECSKWLIQSVQLKDRDRYLCAMFLPKDKREAAFSVLEFHADVARIRESTTELLIAAMRFQAMRDWIESAGSQHKQGDGCPAAIRILSDLDNWVDLKPWLLQILDVRQQNFACHPFHELADAENWVRSVTEPLAQALLRVCAADAIGKNSDVPEALLSVFIAHGLVGLLRSIPYAVKNDFQIWQVNSDKAALRQLVKETVAHAHSLVLLARETQADVPHAAFPLLLHGPLALQQMKGLYKLDYDVFDERFCGPSKLGAAILIAALRKKI